MKLVKRARQFLEQGKLWNRLMMRSVKHNIHDSLVCIHDTDIGIQGAGFLVTPKLILTNTHVVEAARSFSSNCQHKENNELTNGSNECDACMLCRSDIGKQDLGFYISFPSIDPIQADSLKATIAPRKFKLYDFKPSAPSPDGQSDLCLLELLEPVNLKPVKFAIWQAPYAIRAEGFPRLAANSDTLHLSGSNPQVSTNQWIKYTHNFIEDDIGGFSGSPVLQLSQAKSLDANYDEMMLKSHEVVGITMQQESNFDLWRVMPVDLIYKTFPIIEKYARRQVYLSYLKYAALLSVLLVIGGLAYLLTGQLATHLENTATTQVDTRNYQNAERRLSIARFLRPRKASLYYNIAWVEEERLKNSLEGYDSKSLVKSVINNYQRAIDLSSDSDTVNYYANNNLARLELRRLDNKGFLFDDDLSDDDIAKIKGYQNYFSNLIDKDKIMSEDPGFKSSTYKNLAWTYVLLDDLSRAQDYLTVSISADDNNIEAYCLLALIQITSNQDAYNNSHKCFANAKSTYSISEQWLSVVGDYL